MEGRAGNNKCLVSESEVNNYYIENSLNIFSTY